MKRLSTIVLVALAAAALLAVAARAAPSKHSRRAIAAAEHSVNLVLAGSPGNDQITVELSADGRTYEIESATALEVGGTVCTHPE